MNELCMHRQLHARGQDETRQIWHFEYRIAAWLDLLRRFQIKLFFLEQPVILLCFWIHRVAGVLSARYERQKTGCILQGSSVLSEPSVVKFKFHVVLH